MILSLPGRFAVFLLLIVSAPLYILLRFFYGSAFFRLVLFALLLNILGLPFLSGFFAGHPLAEAYDTHYAMGYGEALLMLAVYVTPIHLGWTLFGWYARDGRHDVDDPGRPLIPYIHPWLIDIPVAVALPFAVASLAATGTAVPIVLPEWAGFTLPDIHVAAEWWPTSVAVSTAYVIVAVMTVEPPRLRLRRWWKLRPRQRRLRYDTARIAIKSPRRYAARDEVLAQRPTALQRLADLPREKPMTE